MSEQNLQKPHDLKIKKLKIITKRKEYERNTNKIIIIEKRTRVSSSIELHR